MSTDIVVKMIFGIVGGLGIFLLGMKNMSEGMQAVVGDRMRALINAVTNNRFVACGVGLLITMLIQSSSVTTVMVVGMVNAGLMTLTQAIGVILGADIGTTITAWILVLEIGKYGLPILGVASFFFLFSQREKVRYTAMMILGLGMVFFGLELMKGGFYPLREMPEFQAWFSRFTPDSFWGVWRCCLVGAAVTAIVQSSSATVGITLGLVSTGVIDFRTGAALVLGENIGTTITACLASIGASTNAKRTSLAHVTIKVIGVMWITAIFFPYVEFIERLVGTDISTVVVNAKGEDSFPYAARAIAYSHTCFNIANVVILISFTKVLARILTRVFPGKLEEEVPHLKFIDVRMLDTPAIGIQQSQSEILRMSQLTRKMLNRLRTIIVADKRDETLEAKIFRHEEILDIIQKEIVQFLSNLLSGNVPHTVMNIGRKQLRMADEYESISDYITNILKLNLKMRKAGMQMLPQAREEILDLHGRVSDYIDLVNGGVKDDNQKILVMARTDGDAITHLIREYRSKHLERVENGHTSPLNSLIITDIFTSYRRVKDHALNIAEVLAGEK